MPASSLYDPTAFDNAFSNIGSPSLEGGFSNVVPFNPLDILNIGNVDASGTIPGIPKIPGQVNPMDAIRSLSKPSTMDWINGGLTGLQTIGSLWGAFQAAKLAKKQFKFTKDFTTKNLANQVASYNTTLEDRARSRAAVEDQTSDQMQSYIDKNRLTGL